MPLCRCWLQQCHLQICSISAEASFVVPVKAQVHLPWTKSFHKQKGDAQDYSSDKNSIRYPHAHTCWLLSGATKAQCCMICPWPYSTQRLGIISLVLLGPVCSDLPYPPPLVGHCTKIQQHVKDDKEKKELNLASSYSILLLPGNTIARDVVDMSVFPCHLILSYR